MATVSAVHQINPKAVLLQISGFGATSSRADEPGFGKVGGPAAAWCT
ncbi:hypothetical protein [Streptomyces sp. S465]|nr:hypothetical protein [Streptomyces sp. S465]WAP60204.1 hypothetical protein N6H00_37505 [Streptomyces sp. S465]